MREAASRGFGAWFAGPGRLWAQAGEEEVGDPGAALLGVRGLLGRNHL